MAAVAVLSAIGITSCAPPGGGPSSFSGIGTTVVTLGEIGLNIAAARGDLPPGTVITVAKTVALIREPGTFADKVVPLAEIGLQEAVSRGKVSPGDAILIQDGLAKIKEPTPPPLLPGDVLATTSSK